jgi:hypothetical protein
MSYLNVISLERAKNYLRIDLDLNEDDTDIISMINAACRYIEKRTNHIFFIQDKIYKGVAQVKVFDFPINTVNTLPIPYFVERSTYTIYPDVLEVSLNVGYDTNDVPDELIQACLQMIKVWYFESEKQSNTLLIPMSVNEVIDINTRFL